MKLDSIILENFRNFKDKICLNLSKSNITALIGSNDAGKSTFLDALDIFFSSNSAKIIKEEDINIQYFQEAKYVKKVVISCIFSGFDDDLLVYERFFNKERKIQIIKVFEFAENIELKEFFAVDYSIYLPLINENLENADTKTIKNIYKSILDYRKPFADDARKNKSLIEAIRKFSEIENLELDSCLVKTNATKDVIGLFEKVQKELPFFAYFKTDKTNNDDEPEIQIPLNFAVTNAIDNQQVQINSIKSEVLNQALNFAESLAKSDFNHDIVRELKVEFKNEPDWNSIFKLTIKDKNNVPVNLKGSGSRRVLLLFSFITELKTRITEKPIIFAIEEPETSQHPNNQKLIIDKILDFSKTEKNQFIITTHTPEIAKILTPENLILIENINGKPQINETDFKLKNIAKSLGLMPFYSKLVICVEGENDLAFFLNINKVNEFKAIFNIEEQNLTIIPMTGENLRHWINRNYLKETNVIEFHIYDNDKPQYREEVEKINRENGRRSGIITSKLQIENYIHWSLIEDFYDKENFKFTKTEKENWDLLDILKVLAERTIYKEQTIKKHINEKLPHKMTKQLMDEINSFDDIKNWFEIIKEKMKA